MSVKYAFIASLIFEIKESYKQKSLSEKNKIDLNKIINEMHLLSLIYEQCSQQNKSIIDKELLKFQKRLKDETKNSGGFSIWNPWAEIHVINMDINWAQICKIKQSKCQNLIKDIGLMKKISDK